MNDNTNYPEGADNSSAPWNQGDNPEREVEVTVSITLSKTVTVRVTDYKMEQERDEDGNYYEDIDYSNCDLKNAVLKQKYLPQDAGSVLSNLDVAAAEAIADDFSDWDVDDFEVVME